MRAKQRQVIVETGKERGEREGGDGDVDKDRIWYELREESKEGLQSEICRPFWYLVSSNTRVFNFWCF